MLLLFTSRILTFSLPWPRCVTMALGLKALQYVMHSCFQFPIVLCTYVKYWENSWRTILTEGCKRNRCVGNITLESESWRFLTASFYSSDPVSINTPLIFPCLHGRTIQDRAWSSFSCHLKNSEALSDQGARRETALWTVHLIKPEDSLRKEEDEKYFQ